MSEPSASSTMPAVPNKSGPTKLNKLVSSDVSALLDQCEQLAQFPQKAGFNDMLFVDWFSKIVEAVGSLGLTRQHDMESSTSLERKLCIMVILDILISFQNFSDEHRASMEKWIRTSNLVGLWKQSSVHVLGSMSVEELSDLLYKLSLLQMNVGTVYLKRWSACMNKNGGMSSLSAVQVTRMLFALARMSVEPSSKFMNVWYPIVLGEMQSRAPEVDEVILMHGLWAHAELGIAPKREYVDQFWISTRDHLSPNMNLSIVISILWSSARLQLQIPDFFINFVVNQFSAPESRVQPSMLVDCIWAFAEIKFVPSLLFLIKFYAEFQRAARVMSSQEIETVLISIAKLGVKPEGRDFFLSFVRAFRDHLTSWQSSQLTNIIHALAIMKAEPGRAFLSNWYDRFDMRHFEFSAYQLTIVLWSVATLQSIPSASFLKKWAMSFRYQEELIMPTDLATCLWSLACINQGVATLPTDDPSTREYMKMQRKLGDSGLDEEWLDVSKLRRQTNLFKTDAASQMEPMKYKRFLYKSRMVDDVLSECWETKDGSSMVSTAVLQCFLRRWTENSQQEMNRLSFSHLVNILWALGEFYFEGWGVSNWDSVSLDRVKQVWLEAFEPYVRDANLMSLKVIVSSMQKLRWDDAINAVLTAANIELPQAINTSSSEESGDEGITSSEYARTEDDEERAVVQRSVKATKRSEESEWSFDEADANEPETPIKIQQANKPDDVEWLFDEPDTFEPVPAPKQAKQPKDAIRYKKSAFQGRQNEQYEPENEEDFI